MKATTLLGVILIASAFAGPAEAIYKCTTAKGVVYQDRPCREGNESDLQLVIPTGEAAPRNQAVQDNGAQGSPARKEGRNGATKAGRTGNDDSVPVTKPADKRAGEAAANTRTSETATNTNGDARKKDAPTTADNSGATPTADQARRADPSAKYYTTDGFSAGAETPSRMTCESGTGEKRVFYLSNGKLTSI